MSRDVRDVEVEVADAEFIFILEEDVWGEWLDVDGESPVFASFFLAYE